MTEKESWKSVLKVIKCTTRKIGTVLFKPKWIQLTCELLTEPKFGSWASYLG